MSNDKGFRKMSELVDALRDTESALHSGSLGINKLDRACDDAREFYERLVVIRHKAREAMKPKEAVVAAPVENKPTAPEPVQPKAVAPAPQPEPASVLAKQAPAPVLANAKPEAVPVVGVVAEKPVQTPVAAPAIKLDTRPQKVEQEEVAVAEKADAPVMRTASEFLKAAEAARANMAKPTSIAEKLEKAHIDDLGKAISVSDKFYYTKVLFNNDKGAFERTVQKLNSAMDMAEATALLDGAMSAEARKSQNPEARASFIEVLQRRFA